MTVNEGRHKRTYTVCAHPQCEEIERALVGCQSPVGLFGLADRASVYGHVHTLGLFERWHCNSRAALEKIIERAGRGEVTASVVVAAVQACAKINAAGEWIGRTETVCMRDLLDRIGGCIIDVGIRYGARFRLVVKRRFEELL